MPNKRPNSKLVSLTRSPFFSPRRPLPSFPLQEKTAFDISMTAPFIGFAKKIWPDDRRRGKGGFVSIIAASSPGRLFSRRRAKRREVEVGGEQRPLSLRRIGRGRGRCAIVYARASRPVGRVRRNHEATTALSSSRRTELLMAGPALRASAPRQ